MHNGFETVLPNTFGSEGVLGLEHLAQFFNLQKVFVPLQIHFLFPWLKKHNAGY
jgi:hypothetical protein